MFALVVTFDNASIWMMSSFIRHYRRYGVSRFYISLHVRSEEEDKRGLVQNVEQILAEADCELFSIFHGTFDAQVHREHCNRVQKEAAREHEWIIWADSDELHEFGCDLTKVVERLQAEKRYMLGGHLVDRFARDRSLRVATSQLSPWQQFPLAADITRSITGAWTCKVALAHAGCEIFIGHHLAKDPGGSDYVLDAEMFVVPVHHFKWHSAVLTKLNERVGDYWRRNIPWWVDSERALKWLDSNPYAPFHSLICFDYEDDSLGEGPHSSNQNYCGRLPFNTIIPIL